MDLLKRLIVLPVIVTPIGVVVIGLVTCIVFSVSGRIATGRTGINIMTRLTRLMRLMRLMLAAMAVELLADGLVKLFTGAGQPRGMRT